MLVEKVLDIAEEYLVKARIKDVVIGLSLIVLQLDNDNVGISYVLREGLPAGCSSFPYGQGLIGKPALEVAKWLKGGAEDVQRAIGMAALTAASQDQPLIDVDETGGPFGIEFLPTDTVAMVGYVKPVAKELEKRAKELFVFDAGQSLRGGDGDKIRPPKEQAHLLPRCDIVILSGTTMINNTLDGLLKMCSRAREVVLLGPSTPMFPKAYENTKVTVLAGSWWDSKSKEEIFKRVSLACGISDLRRFIIKKAVSVK
jgi:uncharacterized protein (DUF4213/DUF364 family)